MSKCVFTFVPILPKYERLRIHCRYLRAYLKKQALFCCIWAVALESNSKCIWNWGQTYPPFQMFLHSVVEVAIPITITLFYVPLQTITRLFVWSIIKLLMKSRNYLCHNIYALIHAIKSLQCTDFAYFLELKKISSQIKPASKRIDRPGATFTSLKPFGTFYHQNFIHLGSFAQTVRRFRPIDGFCTSQQ